MFPRLKARDEVQLVLAHHPPILLPSLDRDPVLGRTAPPPWAAPSSQISGNPYLSDPTCTIQVRILTPRSYKASNDPPTTVIVSPYW